MQRFRNLIFSSFRSYILAALFFFPASVAAPQQAAAPAPIKATPPPKATVTNPLLKSGPDPWVVSHGDFFYFMSTTGNNLTIRRTRNIADLATADTKVVWTPPPSGPFSHDIWAPELHFLEGKWYIYFAADNGKNETHRIYVLEGCSTDPLDCQWTMKGKVSDPSDKWAIDPTVLQDRGQLYLLWAGWEGNEDGTENIYIARMSNPWTITGKRVRISTPQNKWEKVGDRPNQDPPHVDVNEAPEAIERNGRIFVTFSASGCWTDAYALGMLTAKSGSDLLDRKSWTKINHPVFSQSPEAKAYGPGHNSFFQSLDGKQDWMIYHANSRPNQGCGDNRSPRIQPIHWTAQGTPDLGTPVSIDTPIPRPE